MRKYLGVIRNAVIRQFSYRMDILGYRLADLTDMLISLAIWSAVFQGSSAVRGYTHNEMMTYVVIGWLFSFLVSNYSVEDHIRRDIHGGELSAYLVRPMSYLRYIAALSVGRSSLALSSGLVVQGAAIFLFRDQILPPSSGAALLLAMTMVAVGYCVRLAASISIGLAAFWFTEVAGANRFLNVLTRFFSGGYLPLNMLPRSIGSVCMCLPFAYVNFVPLQLYLGKISVVEGLRGLAIEVAWLCVLYLLLKITWRRGLLKFEGAGI